MSCTIEVLLEKNPDLVSEAIVWMLELSVGYVGNEKVVALAFVRLQRSSRESISKSLPVAFGYILSDCLNAKDGDEGRLGGNNRAVMNTECILRGG